MYLCTCVSEEGGDGEGTGSEDLSLMSYTLTYVSLTDVVRTCQVESSMYLCTSVSEQGGDGEGTDLQDLSLLSYTLYGQMYYSE